MKKVSKLLFCLLSAAMLLFTVGCSSDGDSGAPKNNVPPDVESKALLLIQTLEEKGFEVSRGYFKLWTIDDCDYTQAKTGLCYGNNAAAPYVISTLLPWPEEYVNGKYSNLWGESSEGYIDIYRFDPREAIVILGQLPPKAAFFSEQTWVFTRQGYEGYPDKESETYYDIETYFNAFLYVFFSTFDDYNDFDYSYPSDTTYERVQILSSLSNPINNVVIERQSDAAFDQVRYFIVTPDQFMNTAVRSALASISVQESDVFTEPIPSNMNIGLDKSSDDFTTWFRYVHPENDTDGDKWRNDLPMVVLRVRDPRSDRKPETYPPVVLDVRKAVDEHWLEPYLNDLLGEVASRWELSDWEPSGEVGIFTDLQTFPTYMVGPLCTEIGENCLLDNWDATYHLYGPMPVSEGIIYAVAGTLGTETGNATYVGVGVNEVPILKGVANLFDQQLAGTANNYSDKIENTDKLFLYYFTLDCSKLGDYTDGNCVSLQDHQLNEGDSFAISIRNYIKPDTERGPDSSSILPAMVLTLTPKELP